MNNELLIKLANQLGTNVESLFNVLVSQASLNGITNIIYYVIAFILTFICIFLHINFSNDEFELNYCDYDVRLGAPMVLFGMLCFVLCAFMVLTLGDTINSFLNPEYWALNKILITLRNL